MNEVTEFYKEYFGLKEDPNPEGTTINKSVFSFAEKYAEHVQGKRPFKGLPLKPKTESKDGELISVRFDLTFIINKDNELTVIDNTQADYKDFVDCNTLIVRQLIFSP